MKTLTITVGTDDSAALGVMGRALLELAGGAAPVQTAFDFIKPAVEPAVTEDAEPVVTEAVEPEVVNEVNTAAVFGNGQAAAPAPTLPPLKNPALTGSYTPPAAAPAAPAAVALDKNGLPWDARINTSNSAKTAQGVWKRKPGLTDEEYQGVLAELRSVMAVPAPAATVTPEPAAAAAPPVTVAPPAPVAAPPAPPAAVVPPAPAAATDEPVPATYAQLLGTVSKYVQTNRITHDEVGQACVMVGLPGLSAAAARPDLIPAIYEGCKAIWSTRA